MTLARFLMKNVHPIVCYLFYETGGFASIQSMRRISQSIIDGIQMILMIHVITKWYLERGETKLLVYQMFFIFLLSKAQKPKEFNVSNFQILFLHLEVLCNKLFKLSVTFYE